MNLQEAAANLLAKLGTLVSENGMQALEVVGRYNQVKSGFHIIFGLLLIPCAALVWKLAKRLFKMADASPGDEGGPIIFGGVILCGVSCFILIGAAIKILDPSLWVSAMDWRFALVELAMQAKK